MRERYLHRCREQLFGIRAHVMNAVGIDAVSVPKLLNIQDREHSYELLQNRIWYHKIAECIARSK